MQQWSYSPCTLHCITRLDSLPTQTCAMTSILQQMKKSEQLKRKQTNIHNVQCFISMHMQKWMNSLKILDGILIFDAQRDMFPQEWRCAKKELGWHIEFPDTNAQCHFRIHVMVVCSGLWCHSHSNDSTVVTEKKMEHG